MSSAPKSCSNGCAYTAGGPCLSPYDYRATSSGCANVSAVMNLTNFANVPFDNRGFLQAKTECSNIYNDRRQYLDFRFPHWPFTGSKLYPVMDYTNNEFPVQPVSAFADQNKIHNEVESWQPRARCRPKYH